MNAKRICSAVAIAVVALVAFGCSVAVQAPVADAPPPAVTQSEPTALVAGSEEPTKPAEPEMVWKPIAWPTFRFDPGVPDPDREFIRRVVKTVQPYFVIPRPAGPSVKTEVRGYWNRCPLEGLLAIGHAGPPEWPVAGLEICLSLPGWRDSDAVLNWRTVAHEWVHVVQFNSGGLSEVPAWLLEGSAEWMAWDAAVHFDVASQAYVEVLVRDWASRVSTPLQSMLTLEQLWGASPGNADSYGVAYWAMDFLGVTPKKLLKFYQRLGEGMEFKQAAKRTFGRAIGQKFYKDFEEFRARGFYS